MDAKGLIYIELFNNENYSELYNYINESDKNGEEFSKVVEFIECIRGLPEVNYEDGCYSTIEDFQDQVYFYYYLFHEFKEIK